ncbi:MAG TPA: hypothetical protein ENJ57_02985 [Rhizobiales bacterium]|nr:hypothetical protein [Hyphomicrobiales bacterium]
MKKTTLALMATAIVFGTASLAYAFGNGPGFPGGPGPMMSGPGAGGQMMRGQMMRGSMMRPPFMAERFFEKADANKDGVITRKEAEAVKSALFAKFDTNGDGVVNAAEIDKGLEDRLNQIRIKMRYMLLARLDANGDGQVSKEEFDKPGLRRFDRADLDHDGKVTRQEMQAMGARARGFMHRRGPFGFGAHRRGPGGAW